MSNSRNSRATKTSDQNGDREGRYARLIGLALALGTLACYWPVRNFDYVNFDDPAYVYDAPMVQKGLTQEGVKWAFQSFEGGNWNPLVWLSHMLDCQIYGLPAEGHHLTNVLLHTANVLLLFLVLRGMTGTLWRSGLAAGLFAWHPLHVESVAWISERKDVLSTLFWLLTMWAYAWYARELKSKKTEGWIWYGLALVFFVLGLMSKAMLVTLPVVLLVMDWWPLKRIYILRSAPGGSQRDKPGRFGSMSVVRAVGEKVPFLALSAVMGVVAMLAQKEVEAIGRYALWLRLENVVVSYVTYLGEFFRPVKLAVFYPYPDSIAAWRAAAAAGVLTVITAGVIWQRKARPYLAAGWLWFMVTLLPVIGLVQVGMQAMADRYTYVPYIGLGVMVSWGLAELAELGTRWRIAAVLAAAAGLAGSAAATRVQLKYWQNSKALFERALAVTSGNYIAYDNLGTLLLDQGKPDEAVEMFSNAVRLNPGLAQAHWNLGTVLLAKSNVVEGFVELKAGLALEPQNYDWQRRLGNALMKHGRAAEALPYYEKVVRVQPTDPLVRFALGQAHLAQKQFEKARVSFEEAARLAPEVPEALDAVARVYATSSRAEIRNGAEAVRLAEKACELTKRQDREMLDTLAAAYAENGRFDDAVKVAEEARSLAEAANDAKTAETERQRAALYKSGKAYHE